MTEEPSETLEPRHRPATLETHCPMCHVRLPPRTPYCTSNKYFGTLAQHEFYASGDEEIKVQTIIVNYHNKMNVVRMLVPYPSSIIFALIAAGLILWAPERRAIAAEAAAVALLLLSGGIAGFTRLYAKMPGLEMRAEAGATNQSSWK